jgi:hypothetical protein
VVEQLLFLRRSLFVFGHWGKILQQLQQSEDEFRKIVVSAESGGGAIQLFMNGLQELVEIRFGPVAPFLLVQERLGGLIGEAFNEALRHSRRLLKEEVSRLTGGINLPEIPGLF